MSFEGHSWFFLRQLRSPIPYFKDLFSPNSAGTLVPDSRLSLKSVPSFDIGRDKVLGCLKLWNSDAYCWPVEDVFQLKEQSINVSQATQLADGDYRHRFNGSDGEVRYSVGPQFVADHATWARIYGVEEWCSPQASGSGQSFLEVLHSRFKDPFNYNDSSGSTASTLSYYSKQKPLWYTYSLTDSSPLKLDDPRWLCRAYALYGSSKCTVLTYGDSGAAVITPQSALAVWWSGSIYDSPIAHLQAYQDAAKCSPPTLPKVSARVNPIRVYQWDAIADPPPVSRASPTDHEYVMTVQNRNSGSVGSFGETAGTTPLRFFDNDRPIGYHLIATASLTLDISSVSVAGKVVTFVLTTSDLSRVASDLSYAYANSLPMKVEASRLEVFHSSQTFPFRPIGTVVKAYVSGSNSISVEFSTTPSIPAAALVKLNINVDTSKKSVLKDPVGCVNTRFEYPLCGPAERKISIAGFTQDLANWNYPPQADSVHSGSYSSETFVQATPAGVQVRYSATQCCGVLEVERGTENLTRNKCDWYSKRYIDALEDSPYLVSFASKASTTFTLVSPDGAVFSFNGPFGSVYLPASRDWEYVPGLYFTTKSLVEFLEHHPRGDDLIRWLGAEKMFRPIVCHLRDGRIAVYDNISASLSNGLTPAALMMVLKPYSLYLRQPLQKNTIEALLNGWIHRSGKTLWVEQRGSPQSSFPGSRDGVLSWLASGAPYPPEGIQDTDLAWQDASTPFPTEVTTLQDLAGPNQCETRLSHSYEDPENNKMPAIDGWMSPVTTPAADPAQWGVGSFPSGYLAESVGTPAEWYGLRVTISGYYETYYAAWFKWAYNYTGDLQGTITNTPIPGLIHGVTHNQAAIQENMLPGNVCQACPVRSYTITNYAPAWDYYNMAELAALDGGGSFFKQRGWVSNSLVAQYISVKQTNLGRGNSLYASSAVSADVGDFNIPTRVRYARWSNPSTTQSQMGYTVSPSGCVCIGVGATMWNGEPVLGAAYNECFCTNGCRPSDWTPVYTEKFKSPKNAGSDSYGNISRLRNKTKAGVWEPHLGPAFKINILRSFGSLGMVLSYGTTPIKFTQTRFRYDESYPWNNTWNRTDPRDTVSEENCYVVLLGAGARVVHAGGELSQWFNENPEIGTLYKDMYTPKKEGWDRITIIDRANGIPVCLSILVLRPDCLPGGDMAWGGSGPAPAAVSTLAGHSLTFSLLSSVFYRAPSDQESTLCGPLGYDVIANQINLSALAAFPRLRVRFLGTMKFSVSGAAFVLSPDAPSTGVAGTGFGPVEGSDDWGVQVLQSFNATSTDFSELRPVASKAMKRSGSGWVLDFSETGPADLLGGRRIGFRIYHKRTGLFQLLDSQRTTGLTGTAKYAVKPATNKGFTPTMTRPAAPVPLVAPSYPTNTNPAA